MSFYARFLVLCTLFACSGGGAGVVLDKDVETNQTIGDLDITSDAGPETSDPEENDTADTGDADDFLLDFGVEFYDSTDSFQDNDEGDDGFTSDNPEAAVDSGVDIGETTTEYSLKLWTFNLLNPSNPFAQGGDVNVRTQIVIEGIKAAQPDLIAFQEVVDSGSIPNRAKFIAEATGYSWEWQKEYSLILYDEGIAVLSKWPIIETESHELPHKDLALFTRYVLRARVETPAGKVDFHCTHMIAFGIEEQSADQALSAFEFISESSVGLPAFFAGDLNAGPDTISMRFLRGEASYKGVTGNFKDAWLQANPGDPGLTSESDKPSNRIDYIYIVPGAPFQVIAKDCELIFTEPVNGVYASDHIGVSCDVGILK